MDTNIITYLACICFIFIFGRIFIVPLKKILKIIFNSVLGGIFIWLINLIGVNFNFHIGLNFFTSILIRCFGITWSNILNYSEIVSRIVAKGFGVAKGSELPMVPGLNGKFDLTNLPFKPGTIGNSEPLATPNSW